MFLLVPAYPGCPGSKAVKRSLFLVPAFPGSPGKRAVKSVCVWCYHSSSGIDCGAETSSAKQYLPQPSSINNKHLAGFPADNCGLCRQFAGLGEMELLCKALVGEERVLVKVLQQTIHTPHKSRENNRQ